MGFFGLFYFDNLTWDNVLIMMIITLLFTYNSILEQRYDSIWMPPAVYRDVQWSSVAMTSKKQTSHEKIMLAILRSCKAIWQWMLKSCIWWWWKLHGNISRNGYGNVMIGRYGGCFEEDIRRLMCDRAYHITGFGCTGEVCTNSRGEKGQCTVPRRLAMMEGWECV